jgi:mRNA-degrading endonuclease toxin of MazEF toxin-antitoxin module
MAGIRSRPDIARTRRVPSGESATAGPLSKPASCWPGGSQSRGLDGYNAKARLAIACRVASHVKGYPFEVPLPAGGKISGVVLADHVKNLDWHARHVAFEAKAPGDVLTDVRERLRVLLGL